VIRDNWNIPVMVIDGSTSREEVFQGCVSFLSGFVSVEVGKDE